MTGSGEKRWQVSEPEARPLDPVPARTRDGRRRCRRCEHAGGMRWQLTGPLGWDRDQRRGRGPEARWQLPPRRHRRRLEGHDGRAEHRHQARPGAPGQRVRDAARRSTTTTSCRPTGWPRASRPTTRSSTRSSSARASSSRTARPLTADDVIYSLQRIGTQKNGLTGFAATATMDIKNIKKIDNLHRSAAAAQRRTRRSRRRWPATPSAWCRSGYRGLHGRRLDADRHRCLQAEELHAGPAERPRAQPELLARRRFAVVRHR